MQIIRNELEKVQLRISRRVHSLLANGIDLCGTMRAGAWEPDDGLEREVSFCSMNVLVAEVFATSATDFLLAASNGSLGFVHDLF